MANTRAGAEKLVRHKPFDLLIVDLELPAGGWAGTLRAIRAAAPRLPVILLAPQEGVREVGALGREADEFLTKPFGIAELLVRVRARLRERSEPRRRFLRAGDLSLDPDMGHVEVRGQPVQLTSRELRLLETLMRHPDEVLSRELLLSQVWGYDFDPGSNVVAVYVRYLRDKLGADSIETVRGAGYRLRG